MNGEYEPIEIVSEADGRHWGHSEALGLEFWWVVDESPGWNKGELRFRDPVSGEFLQTYEEIRDAFESERAARASVERRAETAEAQAESAEARAESERTARMSAQQRAEAAEARMAEMEAELGRLRGG